MEKKHSETHITSEFIKKKFTNQFDLVNHAIKLAENMIVSGRPSRVRTDIIGLNPTNIVLEEIVQGKDYLEELLEDIDEESTGYTVTTSIVEETYATPAKKEHKEKASAR
jgi:hypothetical protein